MEEDISVLDEELTKIEQSKINMSNILYDKGRPVTNITSLNDLVTNILPLSNIRRYNTPVEKNLDRNLENGTVSMIYGPYINSNIETEFITNIYIPKQLSITSTEVRTLGANTIISKLKYKVSGNEYLQIKIKETDNEYRIVIEILDESLNVEDIVYELNSNNIYTRVDEDAGYRMISVNNTAIYDTNVEVKSISYEILQTSGEYQFGGLYIYNNANWDNLQLGVTATANTVFVGHTAYTDNGKVTGIGTADANAQASDILDNKSAYVNGQKIIGTMNIVGQQIITPLTSVQNITEGYHNGTGYIEAVSANIDSNIQSGNIKSGITILDIQGKNSVVDTENGTALVTDLIENKIAYVNGQEIVGTMNNVGQQIIVPSGQVQNITEGYHSGLGYVEAVHSNIDSNIQPENIKSGITILNIQGKSSVVDTEDGNAIADDILFGKTAYVNGVKLIGTMENLEPTIFVVPNGMKFSHSAAVYNNGTGWDIGNVIDMQYMFESCGLLRTLDVSNWDTSNVTDMRFLFSGCYNMLDLDVTNWDVSKVTAMNLMFNYCNLLTQLNVENWDTSNVIHMGSMFGYCQNITTLNLTNWDVSNVQYMGTMFHYCNKLQSIDIGNWNTINVNALNSMFQNCHNLIDVNVYNLNTSNVKSLSNMFRQCSNLVNIDISNWNVNNVTNMTNMFRQCNNLSDASIDSIINMCLNSSISTSYKNLSPSYSYSPFNGSNITNDRYQSRWAELDVAGWKY